MRIRYLIWLGIILGAIIGYFGLPVHVPHTSNQWVWTPPFGFRTASVFMFGTFGYLVGAFVYGCIQQSGKLVLSYGVCSVALIIGIIGFYCLETANNDTMWSMVANGLVRAEAASANITSGDPVHVQGTSVIMAAADIGSASQYFGRHGQQMGMDKVASALAQAGYYLTVDNDAKHIAIAKEYIGQFHPIIDKYLGKTRYMTNPTLLREAVNKLSTIIPPALQQGWNSN